MINLSISGASPHAALAAANWKMTRSAEISDTAPVAVYFPKPAGGHTPGPDMSEAAQCFHKLASPEVRRAIVVSSAEIYGAHHHNTGLLPETKILQPTGNRIQRAWIDFEEAARGILGDKLLLLRTAPTITREGKDFYSRIFNQAATLVLPGTIGILQLLTIEDLSDAIRLAAESNATGTYNIAPAGSIPIAEALQIANVKRIPFPRLLQSAARAVSGSGPDQLDYIRYNWTVSGAKAQRDFGFKPRYNSAQAIQRDSSKQFDDFGMDPDYIAKWGRTGFRALHKYYWRIDTRGLAHIPRQGKAVLTGVHRGFMPFDATMVLDAVVKGTGRIPRFLIHPCLVKMPPLNNFMTRLGGMVACQENADWVLERNELLGIYPEGIRGAFTYYKEAYKLHKFGRDEYVRMALRNRAPIVPFVTVGHAEIFPIFGRIDSAAIRQWTEWPFCPIAPPWPVAPLPLPSKWHMEFLPPIHVEQQYPAEAADDMKTVRAISRDIRASMQAAIDRLVEQRPHLFWGSIFQGEINQ